MATETNKKPFEIEIRGWEDWPDSLLEDSVQGEWRYIPMTALIEGIRRTPFISVTESEEGIIIEDNIPGRRYNGTIRYFLSGRRPDWHSDHGLEDFEIIKKVSSMTECSGREKAFKEPRYIDYGSVGLYTPDNTPLMAEDVLCAVGVVGSLLTAVNELARAYLCDKRG